MYYECDEGWHPLIETFLNLVEYDVRVNGMPEVKILQIKEKFGELRIYYSGGNATTDAYKRFAESMSTKICETCGAPASSKSINGWWKTVCDDHT